MISLQNALEPSSRAAAAAGPKARIPAWVRALVSPVSVKKSSPKPVEGRNTPFSGRLNGVPLPLASAFASNGTVPSVAVSWMVTHDVWNTLP